ncbi:MAG: helix-turn-helix transcriptional regulator [Clostridia bacterium]|nr:helix-turn-helix transcriptional regulator [Clostridia bacterium]
MSREFKKITSNTVVEYINRYRCLKVTELLKDNVPVSESAERCGFTNISYFTKVFKKCYGTVPSKYKSH